MIGRDRVSLNRGWGIVSLTLILDISNIARVSIGHIVSDNLGATVRKGNTVLAVGGIAITSLVLTKVGTRILVSHSVLISVDSWGVISWLLVAMDRLGWMVWSRGWLVSGYYSPVHNWGRVVDWGCLVNDGGSMVDWGWLVDDVGSMVDRSGVIWGQLVD